MQKTILLRIIATLLCAALMLTAAGCAKPAPHLTTVRVQEVTHSVFYAPMYAAMTLGYFEEEGIALELTNAGGADKAMAALLADQADIALCGPEAAVYVYNEGREDYAVIIGQLTARDGSFLISRQSEPDFTWESLANKHVLGGRKGGVPCMTLEYVLRQHGLVPGLDVNVDTSVAFNLMGGAFAGGTGDYTTLFEPTATEFVQSSQGYIVASVGEASGEVPYTAFMVKKSRLSADDGMLTRFLRAMYKGQTFCAEQTPDTVAQTLLPAFEGSDAAVLSAVAERYQSIDAWTTVPAMKESAYNRLLDIMETAGELSVRPPFDGLVDNAVAEAAVR